MQQLAGGGEYRLRRNDLPDDHVERFAGGEYDEFVLTADDELRPWGLNLPIGRFNGVDEWRMG
ncbi:hypothetical protein [Mycobacterium sp. URHB0021]